VPILVLLVQFPVQFLGRFEQRTAQYLLANPDDIGQGKHYALAGVAFFTERRFGPDNDEYVPEEGRALAIARGCAN